MNTFGKLFAHTVGPDIFAHFGMENVRGKYHSLLQEKHYTLPNYSL